MRSTAGVLDGAGAGLSGLCLVHCLALPLLGSALPALAGLAESEWIHVAVVVLAAPVAAGSLLRPEPGARLSAPIAMLGIAGLSLLAFGAFGPPAAEPWASAAGGLTLASAHLANWRRRRLRAQACEMQAAAADPAAGGFPGPPGGG